MNSKNSDTCTGSSTGGIAAQDSRNKFKIKKCLNVPDSKEHLPQNMSRFEQQGIIKLQQRSSRFPRAVFKCRLCEFYCDDVPRVELHLKDDRHRKSFESRRVLEQLSLLATPSENIMKVIDTLIIKVIGEQVLTADDCKQRYTFKEQLNGKIKSDFPGCVFELYGSSVSGCGFKKSNVNLNFCVPPELNGPETMLKLPTWLAEDSVTRDVNIDIACEMPLITFFDTRNGYHCEVTLNSTEAVSLSQLLAKYCTLDPRVILLATTFRHWAEICCLDSEDIGCLPKYAFVVLTVFYLQQTQQPVLPVLPPESFQVFDNINWKSKNNSSVGKLWLGLLKFFCIKYPVSEYVVNISKTDIGKRNGKRFLKKKMTIEDPYQPKKNIASKMVSDATVEYLLHCLRTTLKYFSIPHTPSGPIYSEVIKDDKNGPERAQRKQRQENVDKLLREDERFAREESEVPRSLNGDTEVCSTLSVTVRQANVLNRRLKSKYVQFSFLELNFTLGKKVPLVCTLCLEEGHIKMYCPLKERVSSAQLPVMTPGYINILNSVCEYVVEKFSQKEDEYERRKLIVSDLEAHISTLFAEVKLELFGSSCNGFGLYNSDLDICLTFRNNKTGEGIDTNCIIEILVQHLKSYTSIGNIIPIVSAKVPIIKFSHRKSNLDGDISIYNVLAQRNTRFLKTYSIVDRRVKVLGYMMKHFAKLCNICDASRGSLSSYAYILMVIYYLQQCDPPVLPVLQEIHMPGQKQEKVEGCNVYYYSDIENLHKVWPDFGKNTTSVGELWCDLLHFYAEKFNFDTHVISIRQRRPLLRFCKMWTSKYMAVEDPFDLNHNLGAGLSQRMHLYIIRAFKKGQFHFRNAFVGRRISGFPELESTLFNTDKLIVGEPPVKPCNICNSNGHLMKNCPHSKRNMGKKSENKVPKHNREKGNLEKAANRYEPGIQFGRIVTVGRGKGGKGRSQMRVFENSVFNGPPQALNYFHRSDSSVKIASSNRNVENFQPGADSLRRGGIPQRVVDITSTSRR